MLMWATLQWRQIAIKMKTARQVVLQSVSCNRQWIAPKLEAVLL
jgi:hypothetical protein